MASPRATLDASQVTAFANRLALASRIVEQEAEDFQDEWGEKWADEMRSTVAVGDDPPHLRDAISQVEPGGISMGGDEFDYWRHLENGTSKMAPQPFVRPAMQRIRKPAKEDAGQRAVRLISKG